MNTFSLEGKIMVITGGTNGIGKGLVDYFVEQGVKRRLILSTDDNSVPISFH